jgi:glycosyltransferase involved in cell wall biosynthesis
MKICHVCSGHTDDDSRVFHKECLSLAQAGYEVHLVATGTQKSSSHSNQVIFHPLSTCKSRRERLSRCWSVASLATRIDADLYHVHEPDLLGPVLARARGKPVIFDAHESYLDVIYSREWIPRFARPFVKLGWDFVERQLIKRCAAVVCATADIATRYHPLNSRVVVLQNFTDISSETNGKVAPVRNTHTCVFAGSMKPDRNISNVVRALGILRSRGIEGRLWLAGSWATDYQREIFSLADSEKVTDQVQYLGILSRGEAVSLQARAALGLNVSLPSPNGVRGFPIKMLECMAVGTPIIYSDIPSFRRIAGSPEVGIAVDPAAPEQIADAIALLFGNLDLARRLGENGRRAVREQFNWNVESKKLLALYRDVLKPSAGAENLYTRQQSVSL